MSKNFRVAMFFSGREFSYPCENLVNFLNEYNVDVFISANNKADLSKIRKRIVKRSNNYVFKLEDHFDKNTINRFNTSFDRPVTMPSMFYHHMINARNIDNYEKEKGFKYDIVIYGRLDMKFYKKIKIDNYFRKKSIYVPKNYPKDTGLNDQFAYGTSDNMKKYCQCFNFLKEYSFNEKNVCPERILLLHINNMKLDIIKFNLYSELDPRRHAK